MIKEKIKEVLGRISKLWKCVEDKTENGEETGEYKRRNRE